METQRTDIGGRLASMRFDLGRFSAREIGALIALSTVCLIVLMAVISFVFREPPPEGREAIFQLAEAMLGLAAGLLGGGGIGYAIGKTEAEKGKPEGKDDPQ